ncbi:MAG: S41 family peptidase [Chthoniobacterales bacterium]
MKKSLKFLFLLLLTLQHPLGAQVAPPEAPPKPSPEVLQNENLKNIPADNSTPTDAESIIEQKEIEDESPIVDLPQNLAGRIDVLNEAQLEQAVQLLQKNFVNPASLQKQKLLQARLNGLLERLGSGADIIPSGSVHEVTKPHDFLAEILDGRVGYVRLGSMDSSELVQMDTILKSLDEKKIRALILDIRSIPYSTNFELATEFARRFCNKGRILFRVEKPSAKQERIYTSDRDPLFAGTLVILTNEQTSGAAEVLAETLRQHADAMIVGEKTAGNAVEYEQFPLGAGVDLEVAVAVASVPDGPAIFPDGVIPDITLPFDTEQLDEIFRLSKEQGVSTFVFEKSRPRFNEAALIAEINPEIIPTGESRKPRQALDIVLQRAVDLITAIEFFNTKTTTEK